MFFHFAQLELPSLFSSQNEIFSLYLQHLPVFHEGMDNCNISFNRKSNRAEHRSDLNFLNFLTAFPLNTIPFQCELQGECSREEMSSALQNSARILVKKTASKMLPNKPKRQITFSVLLWLKMLTESYNYHVVDGKQYQKIMEGFMHSFFQQQH